jgi:ABC-type branched-subunit amino acid transport system substrate-binding protein
MPAYTKKPSAPPPFDAAAFTKALAANQPISANLATQYIAWKQWVESSNAFDGADRGGLRDVLDANAKGVDRLKGDVDIHSQAILEMRADIQELQEAPPAHPFP